MPYPVRFVSSQEGRGTPVLVLAAGEGGTLSWSWLGGGVPYPGWWRGSYPVLAKGKSTPVLLLAGVPLPWERTWNQ